ncbi:MAG TPA: hypothetical protein VNN72_28805 [Polyangiaceae bacterium]|nr:hypothetical protein [Polyangiaceae bacterium]
MTIRNALGLLGTSSAVLLAVACGGGDDTAGATGGSSGASTVGGGAGKGSGGSGGTTGGSSGTGGSTGGSSATGSGGGGAGGAAGGTGGGVAPGGGAGRASGGAPAAGSAGMPAMGGSAMGGAGSAGMPAGGTSGAAGAATTGGFTIDVKLASDMKMTAPTTVGIVTWSLDKTGLTEAHIDFGLDTTYGMTAPVDLTAPMYKTLLLGMKPTKTYHFRIVATDGAGTYTSDDKTVTAGAKTSMVSFPSFTIKDAAKVDKGFFIGSFWQGTGSTVPFIVDTDGDVVWWYAKASGESPDGVSRARLSADSKNVWLVNEGLSGAPLRRVSMDTLDVQTYMATKASHDICAVTGDTMAYLDYSESDCNSIFEITPSTTDKGKEVFESSGVTGNPGSLTSCHGNAVRYSKKEDYYTYSDWQNDIAVVDRSGMLKWKLSDKAGGKTAWGGKQHGHQLLDDSILIFANDAAGASKSQAVEFGLDGKLIKKFNSGGGATNFGDVQRLPSGNTLITYSTSNLIQEVDSSDTVVLEVKSNAPLGYVEFRKSLYGEPIDNQ